MVKAKDYPVTAAIRHLRQAKVAFQPHTYPYQDHGGTRHAAECLAVPEHQVIKTLVMQTDQGRIHLVLMHGDREVSTKALARTLGVKTVAPVAPNQAEKVTGYQVGGISPFGTRRRMPVLVEAGILDLDRIYINGGKRGFLVELHPRDLARALTLEPVAVAIES